MTTQAEPTVHGLWYEDFVIGEERVSPGRTVTEADIVNYASLTGDFSQMHTDEEFSKTTEFGTRIAHGMLGVSLASALCLRTLYTRGTAVATLSWGKWQFRKPLYIGDTVHTRWRFTDKRESKSRLDAGIVTEFIELINQNDEVVQDGEHVLMRKERPRDA